MITRANEANEEGEKGVRSRLRDFAGSLFRLTFVPFVWFPFIYFSIHTRS